MPRGRTMVRTYGERMARSEPFEVFTRPQRSTLARILGLLIRLRAEITLAVLLLAAWYWLTAHLPRWAAGLLLAGLAGLLAVIGPTRRYLVRRGLAVHTRHRLRAVFVERRVMNYSGNLPLLLWARPTPVGERVWLLLRAGIDPHDIELNLTFVASGCWARDARARSGRSVTAVVVLDVIRRDPLSGSEPIDSTFTTDRRRLRLLPAIR